ncbi:MAG: hypothetical protein JXQ96_11995 [Cyclobacteriaceae bacterium]
MQKILNMFTKAATFILFFIVVVCANSFAQSTREPDKQPEFESNVQTVKKKKKNKKNKKGGYTYQIDNAVNEYEELMKSNAKKYAKMEKDMKKPQYSDPTYFGHKKKPKKRPVGKRKMCKECGIVH